MAPYTLDDDAHSSVDAGHTDDEAEQRAVAEFVSEIGGIRRGSCQEVENAAEEDEEAS